MKTCLFTLLAILTTTLSAQTFDHALAFGYNTRPAVLCALSDDRFLVVGRGEVMPGDLFTDTIFAVVFDASGNIDLRLRLSAPMFEIRWVNDAVPTPDGGFLISINLAGCDFGTTYNLLVCYDANGVLRWSKDNEWELEFLPAKLDLAPDGQPLGILHEGLIAYDYLTGDTLWQTQLPGQADIDDLDFFPGTLDFAAVGNPDLQIWRQFGPVEDHSYFLDYSADLLNSGNDHQVVARAEGAYTRNSPAGELIRFDEPGYVILNDIGGTDWAPAADGFWLLNNTTDAAIIIKVDLDGQPVDTVTVAQDIWRRAMKLTVLGDIVALVGIAGSGKNYPGDNVIYDASHLWLHTMNLAAPGIPATLPDAALTAVQQLAPVHVETFTFPGPPYYTVNNLSGGNFWVQVTNNGSSMLQQVDVMILFGWNQYGDICFMQPAYRKHYDNLNLPPGASAWRSFGDVVANGQMPMPTQYCFWTAAPNEQPDANHGDDTYCHSISVGAGEAADAATPRLFPNPAGAGGFWAELPATSSEAIDYQLCDALGQCVSKGQFAPDEARVLASTATLPAGLYFFQAGKWRGKVVVER